MSMKTIILMILCNYFEKLDLIAKKGTVSAPAIKSGLPETPIFEIFGSSRQIPASAPRYYSSFSFSSWPSSSSSSFYSFSSYSFSYYYSSSSSYYSLSSSFFFYSYKKNTIKVKITLGSRKNNIYNRVGVGVGAGAGQKTAPAPPKNPRYGRLWRPCMKGRLRNTELPVAADFLTIFQKKLEGRGESIRFFLVIMFIQFSDFTWI